MGRCGKSFLPCSSSKALSFVGFLAADRARRFSGTEQAIKDHIDRVGKIVKAWKGNSFEFARTEADKVALWSARKESLWAMLAQREPGTEIWSTDCAVPLSRLAEIIGNLQIFI